MHIQLHIATYIHNSVTEGAFTPNALYPGSAPGVYMQELSIALGII